MIFSGRNNVIKFLDDYGSMLIEAQKRTTDGEGLKILTSKQVFS